MTPEPKIEFLYFEDCPSHGEALQRLRDILGEVGLSPSAIHAIRIDTPEAARTHRFPGSPTIRIDQRDIDPTGQDDPPGLACRAYHHDDGRITALPPIPLIRRALRAALDARAHNPPGDRSP